MQVPGTVELPKVEPAETTAPAVGVTLQPAPTIEPVAKPKDYEAMIEQALAEPLPVETAASAAGLLKTPVGVPAGVNPAVMAAPQEAAETAAPILGPMGLAMPSEVGAQPGQTILPPAPAPEVGMGMMPPTETGAPMPSGAVTPGTPGALGAPGTVPNGAPGAGPSVAPGAGPGVAPGAFQIPGAA